MGAGQPHAEVEALQAAGESARGGTAVVTLEPCRHTGRTGPCTEALLDAGIAKVVFAQSDPNPVAAGGAQALARPVSGRGRRSWRRGARAESLWSLAMERRRPYLTWKVATTVDGRVAAADRTSRWITGDTSRDEVHLLRSQVDAVMVGTGTVLHDDPHLTVRDRGGNPAGRQPLRVVVGERDLPVGARVADDAAATLHLRTHSLQCAHRTGQPRRPPCPARGRPDIGSGIRRRGAGGPGGRLCRARAAG